MAGIRVEMAGTLLEIKAKAGDKITAGQEVAVVESMKMEVPVTASVGGTVTKVMKAVGDFINEGELLLEINT